MGSKSPPPRNNAEDPARRSCRYFLVRDLGGSRFLGSKKSLDFDSIWPCLCYRSLGLAFILSLRKTFDRLVAGPWADWVGSFETCEGI